MTTQRDEDVNAVQADDVTVASEAPTKRRLRADAVRSEDALLEAAKLAFVELGVDVPVRDIAMRAGVGVGTLYRRFPTRADLVTAVFRHEVDACTAEAAVLAKTCPPFEALAAWLKRYTVFLAAKKGLAAALHSGDPAYQGLPDYFRGNFEPALTSLLASAADAGTVRSDIVPYDLLKLVGSMSASALGDEAFVMRMLDLIIDGLRFGADTKDGAP
ncbi:TetR/AcrR family transcriptional regulator [Allorhizobium taibaishanense]|uniref:AcrR family transcriptional regulator n=1 Tax=Allorhizobium taibaishanense TaxID=887144 RepID=A0A7W6HM64_9HYPH|nr:TetR/AcrR family transcriptional regulator [Allorhizobium taibaishanense]MBB4007764.1 AcrR family transcriptional regulator [Allorhizobium taibaishanense]